MARPSSGRGRLDGITCAGLWKPGDTLRGVPPLNMRWYWVGSGVVEVWRKAAEGSIVVGWKAPFSWLESDEALASQEFMSFGFASPSAKRQGRLETQ